MTTFSEKAWNRALPVIEAIKQHPFNRELARGTLPETVFSFYIEQDVLYLDQYARCLAFIAARAPARHSRNFLRYAEGVFITEQEVVHSHFRALSRTDKPVTETMATLAYTHYLLSTCSLQAPEVAIAAILPCFWVYREVGRSIVLDNQTANSQSDNPYSRWIETYSGADFNASVEEAISIANDVAATVTPVVRDQMLEAFYTSTVMEWHFWNDAYYQRRFDSCDNIT